MATAVPAKTCRESRGIGNMRDLVPGGLGIHIHQQASFAEL